MQGKVAVLGDADFVMPFSALGLDTYTVGETRADAAESAERIIAAKYALILIAENIAPMVEDAFSAVQNAPAICTLIVPFTTESQGFATKALADVLRMATGIDIVQND